jgi:hypothetical protein
MPLVAERDGEIFFLNRRDPFPADEAARILREQGAGRLVDGRLDGGEVEVVVNVASAAPVARSFPFDPARFFDVTAAIARWLAPQPAAGAILGPPILDAGALDLYLEAEDLGLTGFRDAAALADGRARRAALLAEAARRDPTIASALASVGPRG